MTIQKTEKEILEKLGVERLNEMQLEAREKILKEEEVLLRSPTGTGKTLAFLLPLISVVKEDLKKIQVLIIVPSRELAIQIEQVIREMGTGLKTNAFYGGRSGTKDKIDLNHPPAILIGTPGRIASHLYRETFDVSEIHTLVLDEFDKSLEIGFDDEMIEIVEALPNLQKKVLTSATFGVEIPDFVGFESPAEVNYLDQKENRLEIVAIAVAGKNYETAFIDLLCHVGNQPGIVFCNYKDTVGEVGQLLNENRIEHATFHGGMEQRDRERALIQFRNGSVQLLVATDLAARGLDIPDLKFIIHYQLPHREEEFTHRNGRTARMHADGTAYLLQSKSGKWPGFIPELPLRILPEGPLPAPSKWKTVFISGGRKDKISKGDIVGLFLKQAGLQKADLGIIELKTDCAFVAVAAEKAGMVIQLTNNTRLKKKKVRVSLI